MRFLFFFILLCNATFVKAQLFGVIPINKFQAGYYYDLNDQKISGKIAKDASSRNTFTSKTYFLFKSDTDRVRISPDMIKSFVVGPDSFTVSHGPDAQFYKVVIDGPSKLFGLSGFSSQAPTMSAAPGGGMTMNGGGTTFFKSTTYFYGPDADHLSQLTRKNYAEVMSLIVADEPSLVEKIKDKTYRYGDMKELTEVYNRIKSIKKTPSK
eukprot:gene12525-14703_t